MGTAGAYGGSAGSEWQRVRQDADRFVDDPSAENAADVIRDVLDAMRPEGDGEESPAGESPEERPAHRTSEIAPPAMRLPGAIAARPRRGRGDGPGGGGTGGGSRSGSGSGTTGGGGGRGRARLASAGGAALAAGTALRAGDSDALARFGLSLERLRGLDPLDQVGEILDAVIPDTGALEDAELRDAGAEALLRLLEDEVDDTTEVVRTLVSEYVFAVCMTEVGAKLRRGDRPGVQGKNDEDTLRDVIRAYADQVELPADTLTGGDFEAAIRTVYGQVEDLL
jgi:hypothetical protein